MIDKCPYFDPELEQGSYTHGIANGGRILGGTSGFGLVKPGGCENDPDGNILDNQREQFCLSELRCKDCVLHPEYEASEAEAVRKAISTGGELGMAVLSAKSAVRQALMMSGGLKEADDSKVQAGYAQLDSLLDRLQELANQDED